MFNARRFIGFLKNPSYPSGMIRSCFGCIMIRFLVSSCPAFARTVFRCSFGMAFGQHVPEYSCHPVGNITSGYLFRMFLFLYFSYFLRNSGLLCMTSSTARIRVVVSMPFAAFFMRPCLRVSLVWYTRGHSPKKDTSCSGCLNLSIPSMDSAISMAPNLSNPGMLMSILASLFSLA